MNYLDEVSVVIAEVAVTGSDKVNVIRVTATVKPSANPEVGSLHYSAQPMLLEMESDGTIVESFDESIAVESRIRGVLMSDVENVLDSEPQWLAVSCLVRSRQKHLGDAKIDTPALDAVLRMQRNASEIKRAQLAS